MITLLSPSKGQDFTTAPPTSTYTTPFFLEKSQQLINTLQPYSAEAIQELMAVSRKIADLNVERFHNFSTPFTPQNSTQALFSFTGDVYSQLAATTLTNEGVHFAQNHLRILSGLYGLLRPLDLIQAYRLEMKTKLGTTQGENLYQFWGEQVQAKISDTLQGHTNKKIINLASNEYFKAIQPKNKLDILTINFKEIKNNKARVIAIFAKRARGLMAHHIMQHGIDDHNHLKNYNGAGYCFSREDSDQKQFTFTRPQPQA
jgi:cytoplasmic iron level regulating protein YaaA (DUF328/UPF0246 family)